MEILEKDLYLMFSLFLMYVRILIDFINISNHKRGV